MSLLNTLLNPFITLFVLLWDAVLFLLNLILPLRPIGSVIPASALGAHGTFPPFIPPSPTDSRSACPMLNALANHSILPHSGRGITFRQLNRAVRSTFNFAPSFCFFVPHFAANFLGKSYWSDTLDLEDLSKRVKGCIEHDASLTRRDIAEVRDQGFPDEELVKRLLGAATGEDGALLTKSDMSKALAERRVECRRLNPGYEETVMSNGFGSANSCTMLTIFGGRVKDLEPMLFEERFVEGWEPRIRSRFGLTMMAFNGTVLPVERGIKSVKKELE